MLKTNEEGSDLYVVPHGKTMTPERALPLPNIFLKLFS